MIYSLFSAFAAGAVFLASASSPALRSNSNVEPEPIAMPQIEEIEEIVRDFIPNGDLSVVNDLLQNPEIMKTLESFDVNQIMDMIPNGDINQLLQNIDMNQLAELTKNIDVNQINELLQNIDMNQIAEMLQNYITPVFENEQDETIFNAAVKDFYSMVKMIVKPAMELVGKDEFINMLKQTFIQIVSDAELMNLIASKKFDMDTMQIIFNKIQQITVDGESLKVVEKASVEMEKVMNKVIKNFNNSDAIQQIATTSNMLPCVFQAVYKFANELPAMETTQKFEDLISSVQPMLPMLTVE